MIFNKAFQKIFFVSLKSNLISKSSSSRCFSWRIHLKRNRNYSNYVNVVIASSAVVGFTAYITYKRHTLCENVDIIDIKEEKFENYEPYDEAIRKSRDLLQCIKDECGAPGMVVGVSINGENIWTEGLGYADVENRILCSADTVIRIASISKSITMAAVAKLWEQGKLDLDKPVQHYVPYFPAKTFDGKPVTITCRQLVSHIGGIRHYDKTSNILSQKKNEGKINDEKSKTSEKIKEFEAKEYYIKDHFNDVKSALDIFKDDPLVTNPGSKFLYTTYGWTLISAIVEAASKEQFTVHIKKLFKTLGMHTTYLDVNDSLIYHRSRNYVKDKNGCLINAPYVDNSIKWAGGGFLSTVGDLLQFGNAMLYSFQFETLVKNNTKEYFENENNSKKSPQNTCNITNISNKQLLPGYLKSKTVKAMWTPVTNVKEGKYGMGWFMFPEVNECKFCESKKFCVYHTGGAVGASSVLLILPQCSNDKNDPHLTFAPKGIIVTILTNLQSVALSKTALKIAQIFDNELKNS